MSTEAVDWEWQETEVFEPGVEERRPERPRRVVRQRPSRRYETPDEMWAWHVTRMWIAAVWMVLAPLGLVCSATAVIFFVELAL